MANEVDTTLLDNLNSIKNSKADIKQALIDKGQNPTNVFADYAQLISDIQTGEDLSEELSAQEAKLAQLESILDNKTAGGKVKLNIYAQPTEPEDKDGIWLQTDKSFDKVYFDEQVKKITVEGWDTITQYPTMNISSTTVGTKIDNYIYSLQRYSDSKKVYKIDIDTFQAEELSTLTYSIYSLNCAAYDTKIFYIDSSSYICSFDVADLTNTRLKQLSNINSENNVLCVCGDNLYIFSSTSNNSNGIYCKYNITQNELIINCAWTAAWLYYYLCTPAVVGDIIYLFGCASTNSTSDKRQLVYAYNTISNTFTKLSNFPIAGPNNHRVAFAVDNYIYIFGNTSGSYVYRGVYKYNILTDTYSTISNSSVDISLIYSGFCYLENNKIIIFQSNKKVLGYALTYDSVYDYEDNSVVVWDGFGKYKTQLTKSADNQEGKIKTLFYDAYHYTTENGLDDTIPTYYGDGTQWIKFKN